MAKCKLGVSYSSSQERGYLGTGEVLLAPDDYHIKIDAGRKIILSQESTTSNLHILLLM